MQERCTGCNMNKNRHSNHIKIDKSRKSKRAENLEKFADYNVSIAPQNALKAVEDTTERREVRRGQKIQRFFTRFGTDIHRVETPVYSRLLNELSRVARFKNVEHKDGFLTFEASQKQRGEIIALLDNLCYTHNIVGTKGVLNSLLTVLKRAGLVVGLFCAVGAFLMYPHLVLSIEYNGVSDKKVQDVLAQFGVEQGVFLWHLDEESVESKLLSLEGISFASVEKLGTRVYVRVVHETLPHMSAGTMGNAIASKDGVVTRVIVYSGTAEVVVGDTVEKGQVLIGDYYIKGEDKIPIHASGEVYVERQVQFERFFPDEDLTATGKSTTKTVVGLFRQSVMPKSPYEQYTVKKTEYKNQFLIPFTVYSWTFYEVGLERNMLSEDDMKAVAYGEIIDKHQFEKVIESDVSIERVQGGYIVKIILIVEEKQ